MKDYLRQKNKYLPQIAKWVKEHGGQGSDIVPFSIEFEEKAHSLSSDPAQLATFLTESKVPTRLSKIITEGFLKLGLQYYFTAGEKEIRCWVVQKGTLAPQAAGVIHGDFERGFIKAEVVAYQDFHDLCEGGKSLGPIKAAGKFRQEGKTYVWSLFSPFREVQLLRILLMWLTRSCKTAILSISNSVSLPVVCSVEGVTNWSDVAPPKKK
jgi:obg-like ATPase 1